MYEGLTKRLRNMATSDGNIKSNYIGLTLLQAAGAIEELQKDLERSKDFEAFWQHEAEEALKKFQVAISNKSRWIPVTERLPDGEAIAFNALKGSYGYHEYLLGYVGADSESDTGFCCENEGEILMNVTHWMPIPQPPKDGET